MGFNRITAKQAAKMSIRQARPSPLLVTLIFLLLTSGVSAALGAVLFNPFAQAAYDLMEWGYSMEEVIQYDLLSVPGALATYSGVTLLFGIYDSVMSFGYTSYTLRLSRNQSAETARVFDGFTRLGRVLGLILLRGALQYAWLFVAMLPGMAFTFLFALIGSDPWVAMSTGSGLMVCGMLFAVVVTSLRYALADYYLLDDPTCGPWEAIRRSKTAMRGWKMELFALRFSFFGWILLFGLLGGLLRSALELVLVPVWLAAILGSVTSVWILPYMWCTLANFYTAVKDWQPPQPTPWTGGYTGPYHYDRNADGDGPAPF